MRRGLVLLGIVLLIAGGGGYAGGFFYGLRFAYLDNGGPWWLDLVFDVALGLSALGILTLVVGVVVGPKRPIRIAAPAPHDGVAK